MRRLHIAALCVPAALAAACGGADSAFDAQVFAGTWRGTWTDDAGRRGRVTLSVTDRGDSLQLACDVLGVHPLGTRPATERVVAEIRSREAVIQGHRSRTFGTVQGSLDADGALELEAAGVSGPVQSLYALGTWTGRELVVQVDVTYDDSLRTNRARVALRRAAGD